MKQAEDEAIRKARKAIEELWAQHEPGALREAFRRVARRHRRKGKQAPESEATKATEGATEGKLGALLRAQQAKR